MSTGLSGLICSSVVTLSSLFTELQVGKEVHCEDMTGSTYSVVVKTDWSSSDSELLAASN